MADEVLIAVENGVGRLRLNRPSALHALTRDMCAAMGQALLGWRRDPAVRLVLIDHAMPPDGDPRHARGFCAGGDVRAIWESAHGDGAAARAFFHEEYRLNHLLFVYDTPIVAIADGIVMGGGVGIWQPARYRVVTERTLFAMPETGIGLFPDVGGGRYLSRLPGRVGRYLAAAGARIGGADCLALGLATHFVASDRIDALKAALLARPEDVETILAEASSRPAPGSLDAERDAIARLFADDDPRAILAALAADPSGFAEATLATLATKSPQAIAVSLRLLAEAGQREDFAGEMRAEYRLAARVCMTNDFREGVRALLVDKTNDPQWQPGTIDALDPALLDPLFAPLPADEDWSPYPELAVG